jgi:Arc/MetJ-type ribon-helix-helix transcriptional regulator
MATTTDAQTTLTLTLTPEQTAQVNRLVAEGRYASPEEAVNQMILQALDDELVLTNYTPSAKARVQAGIEASLRGEVVHHDKIEGFLDDWERELQA